MEIKESYTVVTPFYQYNSGAGDNGTYYPKKSFETAEKALQFQKLINAGYDAGQNEEYESFIYKWANKTIGYWFYGGYINGYSKVYHEIHKKEQIA
jgi:hypothetical protein